MEITSNMLSYDILQQENPKKEPSENPDKQIPNKQPERHIPTIPYKNPDPTKPIPGVNDPEKIDPSRIEEPEKVDPAKLIWF
jgi:hypothetical protein